MREMLSSRAWFLLLIASGFLVGHAFITAIATYAEMSGANGGPAALSEGLSPLDGFVTPVFSTLSLVTTLLLPFVVIRVVAHERANGAWKLMVQGPATLSQLLYSKIAIVKTAWAIATIPALLALLAWASAGNHLNAAETLSVIGGQALFAWLAIGVAMAAAAVARSEASAAIATLGFTIGTWALDFMGQARGGSVARVAAFTPTAVLSQFERGLVRLGATLIMIVAGLAGAAIAYVFLDMRSDTKQRATRTAAIIFITGVLIFGATRLHNAWDVSENRRNSFTIEDERTLRAIRQPLRVDVHLAAEDPRLADLRVVLGKLSRVLPHVDVHDLGGSGTGLFATPGSGYGEVWYTLGGRKIMTHATAEPVVLGEIYELARLTPPATAADPYNGYPLVARPKFGGILFFVLWPAAVILLMVVTQRSDPRWMDEQK